jgi:hypothetical protein
MRSLEKFLPNEANRRMFPGFVALCLAGAGVALGFIASTLSLRWLGIVALALAAMGVFGGFVFILHGWWRIFRGDWRQTKDPNAR